MVRAALISHIGTFYDGRLLSLSVEPGCTISRFLDLSGFYSFNHITFPDRDQQLNVHLARVNVTASLNTKLSAATFVQYSSAANAVITNVRLRYNAREGNDLYVVYNEGLNTDRYGLTPNLPLSAGRTIVLKYSHTFSR